MKKAIICFTRIPKPGRTKTRLMPHLSAEECAEVHMAFLKDIAKLYPGCGADVFISYTEYDDPSDLETLKNLFPYALDIFPQTGADLGEKMHTALLKVLDMGYESCVLTGSDLPLMTREHIISGFEALEKADVTLGPTADGGYYLVGIKKPCYPLFSKQEYGCGSVYENALKAISESGQSFAPALPCSDVDTFDELLALKTKLDKSSCTMEYLNGKIFK